MNIQILQPEKFIRYKRNIGIIHHHNEGDPEIIFMDSNGETEKIYLKNTSSPLYEELEDELVSNQNLRDLALDADYIFIRNQGRHEYLNYCSIYN